MSLIKASQFNPNSTIHTELLHFYTKSNLHFLQIAKIFRQQNPISKDYPPSAKKRKTRFSTTTLFMLTEPVKKLHRFTILLKPQLIPHFKLFRAESDNVLEAV